MSDDELTVFFLSLFIAGGLVYHYRVSSLHDLYFRNNPGIGLLRLATLGAIAWAAYVIRFHADDSITGIYVWFYLVMSLAVTMLFGKFGTNCFGVDIRTDIYERKNFPAALFAAAFTLGTGIIFGGSLWGDADPVSGDEGGWWIPFFFFLLGWLVFVLALSIFIIREPGEFKVQIKQDRSFPAARATAVFALSTASVIVDGVAGDFFGWRHGLLTFGTIGLMVVLHEVLASARGNEADKSTAARIMEQLLYPLLALGAFLANRCFDMLYIPGDFIQ